VGTEIQEGLTRGTPRRSVTGASHSLSPYLGTYVGVPFEHRQGIPIEVIPFKSLIPLDFRNSPTPALLNHRNFHPIHRGYDPAQHSELLHTRGLAFPGLLGNWQSRSDSVGHFQFASIENTTSKFRDNAIGTLAVSHRSHVMQILRLESVGVIALSWSLQCSNSSPAMIPFVFQSIEDARTSQVLTAENATSEGWIRRDPH